MPAGVDKKERLLNLAALLLNTTRPVSAMAVRQRVDGYPESDAAFHRAFERDKEDLREIGIPLRTLEVPGTDPPLAGYQIPADEYYLPDPGLTTDELAALHFATLAVQFGDPDHEALWKLGGVGVVGVGQVETLTSLPADANLVLLFDAILAQQAVTFDYNKRARRLEPWHLDYQRGRWYVTGLDTEAEAERKYRLDRIGGPVAGIGESGAVAVPERIAVGERRVLRAWEIGAGEPFEAKLKVKAKRVQIARQRLGSGPAATAAYGEVGQSKGDGNSASGVTESEDAEGNVVFTVPVVNPDAFRSFVLEFLDDAELVGPEWLRKDMIVWLRNLVEV